MGFADALWLAAIVGGSVYLFYRSFRRKKGHCQGCANVGCSRRALTVPAAIIGAVLLATTPLRAAEPGGPPVAATAASAPGEAEFYHTPAEKKTAGLDSRLSRQLAISGLLEVEASFTGSGSSIDLATAQIGLRVDVSDNVAGTLVVLAEDGGDPAVDEATVDLEAGPWSARVGLQLLPFGRYNSHFVTDPLTQALGETKEAAVRGDFTSERAALCGFIFSGEARDHGDEERIEDWGAALTVTPAKGVDIGVSYLSDIADGAEGRSADAGNLYHRRLAGWSAHAVAVLGPVELAGEVLGALDRFSAADGAGRPLAWNIELAHDPTPHTEVTLRCEGGRGLPDGVKRRHGVNASWRPREQVSVAVEFLRAEGDDGGDDESVVTTRLSLEF